jgi:orotidine-5'-phosphate decarboxylase
LESAAKHGSRIVLALDVSGPYETRVKRAEKVLDSTEDAVAAVKLNQHLLLPFGLAGVRGLVERCRDDGLPVIADLKLNDIEATNLDAVRSLFDHGFDAVIANPFVGREEGLGGAVEYVHQRGGGILFLVYMSHRGAGEGYGLEVGGEPMYKVFARRAKDWGADGVIVSAKDVRKIEEVRRIVGESLIFSPGVGAQGGDVGLGDGQGSDFVIVGRALTEAADPAAVLRGLNVRR